MRFTPNLQLNLLAKAGDSWLNRHLVWLFGVLMVVAWVAVMLIMFAPATVEAKSINKQKIPEKFPRLANYFLDPYISDAEARELAQWDLVILGFDTQYNSPGAFKIMREANPDIVILAYAPSEELVEAHLQITDTDHPNYKLYSKLNTNDDWYLRNTSGDHLYFWEGSRMINVDSGWNKALPKFMSKQVLKKHKNKWDGVFYDNCFNDISWLDSNIDMNRDGVADNPSDIDKAWKQGMKKIMKQTRKRNKGKFIVCNSSGNYYTYINGRLIEAFPSEFDGGWGGSMRKYFDVLKTAKKPSMVVVNTVANSSDSTNYQLMRYNLTSALLGDGFASYDESIDRHASLWWYDEYSVAMGNPLGGAFNVETNEGPGKVKDGVWRRNFQRGTVIINATDNWKTVQLEDGFEKILGSQDTITNDGNLVGSVTLPPRDGIVLRGRVDQVVEAQYVNGTNALVFNSNGNQTRKPFFSYNSLVNGDDRAVYLEDINTLVVAGDTYVNVFRNNQQVARFAPYGEAFGGGVNIDVSRMHGEDNGYTIVTGTQKYGPHIKMYSLKGKERNAGCFPYHESFRGGVNLAIGDVDKGSPGKEVIVAAAQGGGPHIRILNRNCKLISPGFFAYDANMNSGVLIGAGDLDGDGKDEIVTVPGRGAAPYVRVFNKNGKAKNNGFYAFDVNDRQTEGIAVSDIDADGTNEIVVMSFSVFGQ